MSFLSFLFNSKREQKIYHGSVGSAERQTILERWAKIEELKSVGKPSAMKEAVIEADKLVDLALASVYPSIDKSVERLKQAKEMFLSNRQDYENLWYAHKIRNELVHTVGFDLPGVEAKNILAYFRKALEVMGI